MSSEAFLSITLYLLTTMYGMQMLDEMKLLRAVSAFVISLLLLSATFYYLLE